MTSTDGTRRRVATVVMTASVVVFTAVSNLLPYNSHLPAVTFTDLEN